MINPTLNLAPKFSDLPLKHDKFSLNPFNFSAQQSFSF